MATQIAFSDLNAWLTAQAENTPQTAYEIEVTGLADSDIAPSYTEGSLGYVIKANPTKYVDLSETEIPDTIDSMADCFYGCGNLIKSPAIPSGVETLANCFYEWSSLIQAPSIPHNVRDMYYCFYRCTSLTQAPALSVFTSNLVGTFYGCTNITNVPAIPSSVVDMNKAFKECAGITTVPAIPSGVENMEEAFAECYNISYVAGIPSTVLNMKNCFLNCINLERINSFTVPLATLKDNEDFQDAFKGCSSLTAIGYEPQEAQDWHIIQLSFSTVGGTSYFAATIYSRDGTDITVSAKPFTGSTVKLPVLTDELWYPEGMVGWQVLDTIDEVISTRLSYWNKDVLDPSEKHFVMKAADPLNFISNLPFVTVKRISQGGNSLTSTYTLDNGEKFSNWDFIIPIATMYDDYQHVYQFIPESEIEWCINNLTGSDLKESFLLAGSTGGTDRRIAWGAVSDTQWVIGLRNGTSGHLPKFGGFFGVRFSRT